VLIQSPELTSCGRASIKRVVARSVVAGEGPSVRLDKKNAREAAACAEAQTGKRVEQIAEK